MIDQKHLQSDSVFGEKQSFVETTDAKAESGVVWVFSLLSSPPCPAPAFWSFASRDFHTFHVKLCFCLSSDQMVNSLQARLPDEKQDA